MGKVLRIANEKKEKNKEMRIKKRAEVGNLECKKNTLKDIERERERKMREIPVNLYKKFELHT